MILRRISALSLLLAAALGSSTAPYLPVSADPSAGMFDVSHSELGVTYLTWLQQRHGTGGYELLFSALDIGGRWSGPRVIAGGDNWFINYADHPSIEALGNGSLVVHWLERNAGAQGSYGYGLSVAMSADAGRSWRTVYRAGLSNIEDYTGFLSFLPDVKGFTIAYLAPPDAAVSGHIKTLRFARFGPDGKTLSEQMIDSDVCTCCPTAMAMTANGPIIAYRDHQPNEIRDISVLRQVNGRWLGPQTVSADGWQINGCPSDGPAMSSKGDKLAVAWFTRAKDVPQVKVAFSQDSGRQFRTAIRIDSFNPVGRADIQLVGDLDAVVSWIEREAAGGEIVCLRRVSSSGQLSQIVRIGSSAIGRAAGFPKIRVVGRQILVVWKTDRLVSRLLPIPSF